MDPRWGTFRAAYEGGSGTSALTFAYTVAEPNTSPPGIAVLADTLELNGGTIRSAAGTDAALAHVGLGHDPRHKVDWRLTPPSAVPPLTAAFVGMPAGHAGKVVLKVEATHVGQKDVQNQATAAVRWPSRKGGEEPGCVGEGLTGVAGFAEGQGERITYGFVVIDDEHGLMPATFRVHSRPLSWVSGSVTLKVAPPSMAGLFA